MKYMGSKARIAKHILPIMLKGREEGQTYVEPFAGGMNSICQVTGKRIANDINPYLIDMWITLTGGWEPPEFVTKDEYVDIRDNKGLYPSYLVGWVGFNCSYSGKWFAGYAGLTNTKIGTVRNYQAEAIANITSQVPLLKEVLFYNSEYSELELPPNSIVYCDPPYAGTTKYKDDFDHDLFWEWCRQKSREGHSVFVSEYTAPPDFECIWSLDVKSSLSANGKSGGNKTSTEKLFIFKP